MRQTSGPLVYSEVKGLFCCEEPWWIETGITDRAFMLNGHDRRTVAKLEANGRLWALPGFFYDGSSGPTDDDGNIDPVPAIVHDIGYEAIRTRDIEPGARPLFDALYRDLLAERKMGAWFEPHGPDSWWKVWQYWRVLNPGYRTRYYFLRAFGGPAASPIRGPQYPKRKAA